MFDQSFNSPNLSRLLEKRDFLKDSQLKNDTYKANLIKNSSEFVKYGIFTEDIFKTKKIKNKPVYELIGVDKNLALRKANENIKKIYNVKQNDRDFMIKQLKVAVSEGIDFSLYKLDIKQFYESFNQLSIISEIENNKIVSYDTKLFVLNLIKSYSKISRIGLPRGLSISATLSEIMMINFDLAVRSHNCVYYYFRFVDDIIIITNKNEGQQFNKELSRMLPKGLVFHNDKSEKKQKISLNKATPQECEIISGEFNYLGYNFKIFNPLKNDKKNADGFRCVYLDISNNKVKKIKSRILRSLINFLSNNDFKLLSDRVKFLTSNFKLKDKRTEIDVMSGIFFNYKRVNYEQSKNLKILDDFLYYCISTNNVCGKNLNLSSNQKRTLFKYSFQRGFKMKKQINLTPSRQILIQRTWIDV